jgi:phosphatidate phosphatase LPIN
MIIEEQMDKVVTKLDPYTKIASSSEEEQTVQDPIVSDALDTLQKTTDELTTPPPATATKNDLYPMDDGSTLLERVIPEAITTTTVAKERFIVRPAQGDIYSTWMDVTHTSVHHKRQGDKDDKEVEQDSNDGHGKGDESIVLDIAGYKTGGDEVGEEGDEEEDESWLQEQKKKDIEIDAVMKKDMEKIFLTDEEDQIVQSPPAIDQEEAVKDQVVPEVTDKKEDENVTAATVTEEEKMEEESTEKKEEDQPVTPHKRSLWGWGSARRQATNESLEVKSSTPTASTTTTTEGEKKEEDTKKKESRNLELVPGTTYRIEMSLCGFSAFGKDEQENARVFDEYISTYDNFTHNPNMLNDKRLVFRYEGRYYAAGHTGPLFTSLLLFKKPLEDNEDEDEEKKVSDSRESYQFGKGWRQWLSRSSVAAPSGIVSSETTGDHDTISDSAAANPRKSTDEQQQETTTFTTTTTTTSVGWSADHVHPGQEGASEPFPPVPRKVYAKTLRLTSDQLKSLQLKKGVNTISFSVSSAYQGTATCAAKIFYWDYGISVVISDIDGTITKSDTLGHVFTMIGKDWTHMGVAKLYTDIANNGYHFLYLTSRAIGQADYTRDYLKKVVQDNYQLPDGPVIMSPDRLFTSLHREVIMRKPEVFKMACLRDVQRLFGGRDPFYAGFGNRITDARSYRSVKVPTARIFTIDPYGDLKLELLMGFRSSYIHLNDLVDQIFPPINRVINEEYNDWNYWKSPFPEIDIPELDIPLEPTSPKPKPIKPDPSALPASSVVASTSSTASRSLLRSFTSRSDSGSSTNSNSSQSRKIQSSASAPTLKKVATNSSSRKFSFSSSNEDLANDTEVTSDQKSSVPALNTSDHDTDSLSTSPTGGSIMNKMRSTLSRTFLSSPPESGVSTPAVAIEEEQEQAEEELDDKKVNKEDDQDEDSKNIQEDVDSLLDDIDMDDIPFI